MINLDPERPCDFTEIENLLDLAFGPNRHQKSSYSLRQGLEALPNLCWVAREEGVLVGSIRYFPIHVCDMLGGMSQNALLLGPIVISPTRQNVGIGRHLMTHTLAMAGDEGHKLIFLVGDHDYYCRFGFDNVLPRYITLPGGRDARRLQVYKTANISTLPMVGKLMPGWTVSSSVQEENMQAQQSAP